jgi:pimeloyl-ACP methyl ester carboxylesterase
MPTLDRENAHLHWEEAGAGSPILTTHGLTENADYWSLSGVTAALAERHRVISMDMRGHGRTRVEGPPFGFDVDTLGDDVEALADHLGLDRFHLLTHATGGMVGVRYAMRPGARLASLILTDTGSATAITPGDAETRRRAMSQFAASFEGKGWDEILARARKHPGPFLFRLDQHPERERLWGIVERIFRLGDPDVIARFIRSFYTDPDPRLEGLRSIRCPSLVLLGEHDVLFVEPSRLMAREIPRTRWVCLAGIGHMTAIEDPGRTLGAILEFLADVEAGRA